MTGFSSSHVRRELRGSLTCRQTLLGLAAVGAAPAIASFAPRPATAWAQDQITLTLVAYSTPREAYEEIIPLFQATPEGANVVFETSFAASTEQSRAVESGLPADVLALSLEPDITRLIAPVWPATRWRPNRNTPAASATSSPSAPRKAPSRSLARSPSSALMARTR